MTETANKAKVEISAPPLHMPNAASTAENAIQKALDFCAQKMRLESREDVVSRLQQRDHCACEYCYYSLAEQVSAALGALDDNIKSAYMFEYEATVEDVCFAETKGLPLLHLLVWTHRKSEALYALVNMLDRALVQDYSQLVGPAGLKHLLDVQIVDDADVEGRIGTGALLHSIHHRPLKVWQR